MGVTIHSAGVAGFEVAHLERERLLVELCGLSLPGIYDSGYTGRKHIVDRLCAVVLLDIHRTDVERAFCRSVGAAVEVVLICAPFAPHEFEGGKAQVGCLFEAGHEHAGEADGGEVVDASHHLVGGAEGYLELVPNDGGLSGTGGDFGDLLVGDVVAAHLEVFGAD